MQVTANGGRAVGVSVVAAAEASVVAAGQFNGHAVADQDVAVDGAANVGGINVLNITTSRAINPIVLDDSNGSQWIVNIPSGTVTTGNITTSSGSSYDVLINVDTSGGFQINVPTAGWEGILFDDQQSPLTIDGSFNGEVIDGATSASDTLTIMSGQTLDHPARSAGSSYHSRAFHMDFVRKRADGPWPYALQAPRPEICFRLTGRLTGGGMRQARRIGRVAGLSYSLIRHRV